MHIWCQWLFFHRALSDNDGQRASTCVLYLFCFLGCIMPYGSERASVLNSCIMSLRLSVTDDGVHKTGAPLRAHLIGHYILVIL